MTRGEVTEVVGTVMDVTEQWKARTELEKAFEEIKQADGKLPAGARESFATWSIRFRRMSGALRPRVRLISLMIVGCSSQV